MCACIYWLSFLLRPEYLATILQYDFILEMPNLTGHQLKGQEVHLVPAQEVPLVLGLGVLLGPGLAVLQGVGLLAARYMYTI